LRWIKASADVPTARQVTTVPMKEADAPAARQFW
jgi:hypothetical protein